MQGASPGFRLGLVLLVLSLAACSRPGTAPPRGLAGLRFGEPPSADLVPVPVVLPQALAGVLRYYRRLGPTVPFRGVALVDPIFGFCRGRLFSVLARLAEPAAVSGLRRDLEAHFGPPLCRERAGRRSCLWRLTAVDVVVEQDGTRSSRLLVRHRALAAPVLTWRGRASDRTGQERTP